MLNIITITKDDLKGVTKTINSTKVLREKYNVLQIIVDNSEQKNRVALKQLVSSEKNLQYLSIDENGISNAFNYGIKKSKGDWLWFLNGGDTLYEKADLCLLMKILNEVSCDLIIFEIIGDSGLIKHPPISELWPAFGWVPHPASIIKRKCLQKVGIFDDKYKIAMDGDLWMRIFSQKYVVDLISLPITNFAPGGLSSNKRETGKEVAKLIWNNKRLLITHCYKTITETILKWLVYTFKK